MMQDLEELNLIHQQQDICGKELRTLLQLAFPLP